MKAAKYGPEVGLLEQLSAALKAEKRRFFWIRFKNFKQYIEYRFWIFVGVPQNQIKYSYICDNNLEDIRSGHF